MVKCPLHIFGVEGKMGLVIVLSLGGMVGILSKNLEDYTTLPSRQFPSKPAHLERDAVLGHDEGEHGEGEHLAGVRLRRSHSDLGTGVDVDPAVGLAADCGTHLGISGS